MFFESYKIILTKNGMIIEKKYLCVGHFKMNIMIIIMKDEIINNKNVFYPYLFELYDM
jgi:hypothetical protein